MIVHCGNSKQRRNCHMVLIHASVGQDQNIGTVTISSVHLHEQMLQCSIQRGRLVIQGGYLLHLHSLFLQTLDLQEIQI